MFDLANRIAYDGAMVYGTLAPSPVKETPACLPTGWVHASGRSSGNWVDSEGKVLERLLAMLDGDGVPLDSIAVITPFRTCVTNSRIDYPPRSYAARFTPCKERKQQ